jgi:hypothetical protein
VRRAGVRAHPALTGPTARLQRTRCPAPSRRSGRLGAVIHHVQPGPAAPGGGLVSPHLMMFSCLSRSWRNMISRNVRCQDKCRGIVGRGRVRRWLRGGHPATTWHLRGDLSRAAATAAAAAAAAAAPAGDPGLIWTSCSQCWLPPCGRACAHACGAPLVPHLRVRGVLEGIKDLFERHHLLALLLYCAPHHAVRLPGGFGRRGAGSRADAWTIHAGFWLSADAQSTGRPVATPAPMWAPGRLQQRRSCRCHVFRSLPHTPVCGCSPPCRAAGIWCTCKMEKV